jgi:hypothetical protein
MLLTPKAFFKTDRFTEVHQTRHPLRENFTQLKIKCLKRNFRLIINNNK